jgi:glycine dehydrogenase subunit 2
VGILLRGSCYLRTLGAAGVRAAAEDAILNANYLKARLADVLPVPHGRHCLHEFVASASQVLKERGISAMEIAKRLLDYGYHAPTIYFPLVVPEALMMEPTETESKATLDDFAAVIHRILDEDPAELKRAPETLSVSRPNDVQAARQPVLHWNPGDRTAETAQ